MATELKNGERRWRSNGPALTRMEWRETPTGLLSGFYDDESSFSESGFKLEEVEAGRFGIYEVTPGVPSPRSEQESLPAPTAEAGVAGFDVKADAARDYDQELTAPLPVAFCNSTEIDPFAMCCEPDAEETIDEYVARIDEGVVPTQEAAVVSEWPKSYRWHQNDQDIVTFHNADEIVRCAMGWEWTYSMVAMSNTSEFVYWHPIETPADNVERLIAAFDKGGAVLKPDPRDAEIAELKRQLSDAESRLADKYDYTWSCGHCGAESEAFDNEHDRNASDDEHAMVCPYFASLNDQLDRYITFFTDALAAHAEASPNRVEIMFGRACDKLRAGLRGLDSAPKEEESASSQPLKMEAVPT